MKEMYYPFEYCNCECDNCKHEEKIFSIDYIFIDKQLKKNNWYLKNINNEPREFCCEECYLNYITTNNANLDGEEI